MGAIADLELDSGQGLRDRAFSSGSIKAADPKGLMKLHPRIAQRENHK